MRSSGSSGALGTLVISPPLALSSLFIIRGLPNTLSATLAAEPTIGSFSPNSRNAPSSSPAASSLTTLTGVLTPRSTKKLKEGATASNPPSSLIIDLIDPMNLSIAKLL